MRGVVLLRKGCIGACHGTAAGVMGYHPQNVQEPFIPLRVNGQFLGAEFIQAPAEKMGEGQAHGRSVGRVLREWPQ